MSEEKLELAISDLENFVSNRVWKVIVQTIISRTNEKMEENISIDPFKEPTQIARNQGFVDAMSFIVDLPAVMKEQVEFDNREEKKDE